MLFNPYFKHKSLIESNFSIKLQSKLKIAVFFLHLFSISDIKATVKQEKANNYGTGSEPVSMGIKRKEYEASFSMSLLDVERLLLIMNGANLTSLPPMIVVIELDNGSTPSKKHIFTLTNFRFTDDGYESADGDTEARRTYTGIMSGLS